MPKHQAHKHMPMGMWMQTSTSAYRHMLTMVSICIVERYRPFSYNRLTIGKGPYRGKGPSHSNTFDGTCIACVHATIDTKCACA